MVLKFIYSVLALSFTDVRKKMTGNISKLNSLKMSMFQITKYNFEFQEKNIDTTEQIFKSTCLGSGGQFTIATTVNSK